MTQKTVLFDVDVLCSGIINGTRTGIFFTALNILKQFIADERLDVFFRTSSTKKKAELNDWLEKELERSVEFYPPLTDDERKIGKIYEKTRSYRKQHKNLRKLFWEIYLKIFAALKHKKHSEKTFDIYFSAADAVVSDAKAKKNFVVLYDTTPLLFPSFFKNNTWFEKLIASLNTQDTYFAISEATKKDFLKFFPQIPPEHITATPLAAAESFRPITDKDLQDAVRKKYHIPADKKYVFSLCTSEPRKNLIRAVKTFIEFIAKNKIDDMIFVLGGGQWDWFIGKLENEINNLGEYKDKIIRAGYVDDADLPTLYSGAQWFVYTSQYEGFGLPPLEAMQCGCPVITSNNSSLPEVVGDAGISIDWDSDEQHVKAYEGYYFNDELRRSNAAKGLERAKLFSWQKTANLMITEMLK